LTRIPFLYVTERIPLIRNSLDAWSIAWYRLREPVFKYTCVLYRSSATRRHEPQYRMLRDPVFFLARRVDQACSFGR
jgi:hypothetical protein